MNQSWKDIIDDPMLWIKKFNLKDMPKENQDQWIDLIQAAKSCRHLFENEPMRFSKILPGKIRKKFNFKNENSLGIEMTLCLIKYHRAIKDFKSCDGQTPFHIGMFLHKMSLITNFGHKHYKSKIFHKI